MDSASLLTQTISMPCPENTVPTSPDGVDTDLTGLAEHDVENFRARAARILDRHEIRFVMGGYGVRLLCVRGRS